jgi:serine/threonine protein kinase
MSTQPPDNSEEDLSTENRLSSDDKHAGRPERLDEDLDTQAGLAESDSSNYYDVEQRLNSSRNRYRIEETLGSGGFANVYSAFDRQLKRYVAFKITKDSFSTKSMRRKFLVEARTIARLEHPHILPIYDIGVTPRGEIFVVTRIVTNGDLSKQLRTRAIPVNERIRIVACIADALYHADKNGVIHRDVKPGNILVDSSNHAYLTDFGLALREHRRSPLHEFAGTVAYMSPEQANSELSILDSRTDIYSLGVVLYEMLTNQRPFSDSDHDKLIEKVKRGQAKPVRQIDPTIPEELERIVAKAMAYRIPDRYPSASDFAKELRTYLSQQEYNPFGSEKPLASLPAENSSSLKRYTEPLSKDQPIVIYLAETTADLAKDREILADELRASGCVILPERPLPRTRALLEWTIEKGIDASFICIHPIGGFYGLFPYDSDESIVAMQYRLGFKSDCPQVVWIPKDRPIHDTRQELWIQRIVPDAQRLEGVEIIEDRASTIKEAILRRINIKGALDLSSSTPKAHH